MRINPITNNNSNQKSFNANVHMDLRVAEAYKNDKTMKYLVDTLKNPKIKYSDIYLSIRERTHEPYAALENCLNAQNYDSFKNVIVDNQIGYFNNSDNKFYIGWNEEENIKNQNIFKNTDSFINWLNRKLSAPYWK